MKNLLYIFKLKNNMGEMYFSVITNSLNNALYIVSILSDEDYFPIKSPLEISCIDIKDYDC